MEITSIIAIYVLFWVLSAFLVLPFGIKNNQEAGVELVRGQADGAPVNFRPWRVIGYTTLVATILFALFYINYVNQWITIDDIDFFGARDRM